MQEERSEKGIYSGIIFNDKNRAVKRRLVLIRHYHSKHIIKLKEKSLKALMVLMKVVTKLMLHGSTL